jgi:Ribosome recycling factor
VVQNNQILLKFPPLSTEQREKLAKLVNQLIETTRQKIRNLRDQERKAIKIAFEKKEITEDQKFKKGGSSRVDLQACKLGTGRRFTTS